MHETVVSMQREWARGWAARRVRTVPKSDDAGKRRRDFDDVALGIWVVALIGIVVLCGAVMLLAVISATVPASPRTAGPALDSGAATGPDETGVVLVDDDWVYGPKLTR
jgi:hypothetical protein